MKRFSFKYIRDHLGFTGKNPLVRHGRTWKAAELGELEELEKKFWKKVPEEAARRREELEKQFLDQKKKTGLSSSSCLTTVNALNLETVTGLVLTSGGHEVERISGKSGKGEVVMTSWVLKNMTGMKNKWDRLKVQEQCDLSKVKAI